MKSARTTKSKPKSQPKSKSGRRSKPRAAAPADASVTDKRAIDDAFPEVADNAYGDWLRQALDASDTSVWTLAEQSGVSGPQIYNILAGKSRNPQQKTRDKIEKALGKSPKNDVIPEDMEVYGIGELVDFDPHDEMLLPDVPGVYVFYDITDRPVYVGRAVSGERTIRTRVREHTEKFWFKRPIVNNGAYIQIGDKSLCMSVEKALIKFLKSNAVLNKQHVDRK